MMRSGTQFPMVLPANSPPSGGCLAPQKFFSTPSTPPRILKKILGGGETPPHPPIKKTLLTLTISLACPFFSFILTRKMHEKAENPKKNVSFWVLCLCNLPHPATPPSVHGFKGVMMLLQKKVKTVYMTGYTKPTNYPKNKIYTQIVVLHILFCHFNNTILHLSAYSQVHRTL